MLVALAASVVVAQRQAAGKPQAPPGQPRTKADTPVGHDLRVALDPAAGRITVVDTIALPAGSPGEFALNAQLAITAATPATCTRISCCSRGPGC